MWNFSSIGGTIMRTFLNNSLVAGDISELSDISSLSYGGIQVIKGEFVMVSKDREKRSSYALVFLMSLGNGTSDPPN